MLSLMDDSSTPSDIKAFYRHWRSASATALVPTVGEFINLPVSEHQSNVALLDIHSANDMRIRLFGTGLTEIAGTDLTGADLLSNIHPDAQAKAARMVWDAVTTPCGYLMRRLLQRGVHQISATSIGLPLLREKSDVRSLVGFMSREGYSDDINTSKASVYIREIKLLRWVDIGAGIPDGMRRR
jgi:hypothetical protein